MLAEVRQGFGERKVKQDLLVLAQGVEPGLDAPQRGEPRIVVAHPPRVYEGEGIVRVCGIDRDGVLESDFGLCNSADLGESGPEMEPRLTKVPADRRGFTELLDRLAVPPGRLEGNAEGDQSLRVARPQRDRLGVNADRLVMKFFCVQHLREAAQRLDIFRVDIEGFLKASRRPGVLLQRGERRSEPTASLGIIGVDRQRPLMTGSGFLMASQAM